MDLQIISVNMSLVHWVLSFSDMLFAFFSTSSNRSSLKWHKATNNSWQRMSSFRKHKVKNRYDLKIKSPGLGSYSRKLISSLSLLSLWFICALFCQCSSMFEKQVIIKSLFLSAWVILQLSSTETQKTKVSCLWILF